MRSTYSCSRVRALESFDPVGLQAVEAAEVENPDLFAARLDLTVSPELAEHAADGFELHPEIAADFLTGHLQVEFRSRIAARLDATDFEQVRGDALLGGHRAEQRHESRVIQLPAVMRKWRQASTTSINVDILCLSWAAQDGGGQEDMIVDVALDLLKRAGHEQMQAEPTMSEAG